MKKRNLLILSCFLLTTLVSCDGTEGDLPDLPVVADPDSPSYDGGLEGNEANDDFNNKNDKNIEVLLEKASKYEKYTYEVNVNVSETSEHFTQYFTPNAWYTEGGSDADFGYAQTKDKHYLFKYYLSDDEKTVYPSVYEYGGYYNNEIVTELYSTLTVANIGLLSTTLESLKDDGYQAMGGNRYIILDSSTMSVFQYMSTYGSSITNFINAFYVQIIDLEGCVFETTLDLGSFGTITGRFTPQETTKIDFVNDEVLNNGLEGVLEQEEITDFSTLVNQNNFTLEGITLTEPSGAVSSTSTTIYCTNDYFLYDFKDTKYKDFGFAFIKANTEVPVYSYDEEGNLSSTPTMVSHTYDGCYEFERGSDGSIYFVRFIGPVENENTKYVYVDELPATGEAGYLYIYENPETGVTNVYEWAEVDGKYKWNLYSEWYDTVGDFYVYNYGATFYLSSTAFTALAPSLFEKSNPGDANSHAYFTANMDIASALANGLFGWGFQATTTWMDYITNAYLTINYDSSETIESVDLGLGVMASVGGGLMGEQKISYNFSDFGSTSVTAVEEVLNGLYGD